MLSGGGGGGGQREDGGAGFAEGEEAAVGELEQGGDGAGEGNRLGGHGAGLVVAGKKGAGLAGEEDGVVFKFERGR